MTSTANLPLRRRCLFLVDKQFITEEHRGLSQSPSQREALQATLAVLAQKALEAVPHAREQSHMATETQELLSSVKDALTSLRNSVSLIGAADVGAAAFFTSWEDAIETLLFFLDEVAVAESRNGTASAAASVQIPTAVAEAVRHALCGLIGLFYADGTQFYAGKEDSEMAMMMATQADELADVSCSWSIGAPVAADVYSFFLL